MHEYVTLSHGSGGRLTRELITDVFFRHFKNDHLTGQDSAVLQLPPGRTAYTTDSFVITPIFFKGGDIGRLSVCGTVNDLAAVGARPLYLSCGFIIEEGFPLKELEAVAVSMAEAAGESGVKIVAGDTKVVQKGAADGVFINTSGLGRVIAGTDISGSAAVPGDLVIITGTVGDHGCSIFLEREKLGITSALSSDCAPLNGLVEQVLEAGKEVHAIRDPTRGGISAALNEIAADSGVGIRLVEGDIPIRREVAGICELLGMDPLHMANEGKMLIIAPAPACAGILDILKKHRYGANACVIGEVTGDHPGRVTVKTSVGSYRVLDMLTGDQLPRIC